MSHGPLRQVKPIRLNGPWSPPRSPAFTRHRANTRGTGRTGQRYGSSWTRAAVRPVSPASTTMLSAKACGNDPPGSAPKNTVPITATDQRLIDLHDELLDYPGGADETFPGGDVVLPLRYRHGDQELAMFSISARVSTATDVTVEELAIESFYPARTATASAFHAARRAGVAPA
jgi:hypothetical protein